MPFKFLKSVRGLRRPFDICITHFDQKMPASNLGGKLTHRRLPDLRLRIQWPDQQWKKRLALSLPVRSFWQIISTKNNPAAKPNLSCAPRSQISVPVWGARHGGTDLTRCDCRERVQGVQFSLVQFSLVQFSLLTFFIIIT